MRFRVIPGAALGILKSIEISHVLFFVHTYEFHFTHCVPTSKSFYGVPRPRMFFARCPTHLLPLCTQCVLCKIEPIHHAWRKDPYRQTSSSKFHIFSTPCHGGRAKISLINEIHFFAAPCMVFGTITYGKWLFIFVNRTVPHMSSPFENHAPTESQKNTQKCAMERPTKHQKLVSLKSVIHLEPSGPSRGTSWSPFGPSWTPLGTSGRQYIVYSI